MVRNRLRVSMFSLVAIWCGIVVSAYTTVTTQPNQKTRVARTSLPTALALVPPVAAATPAAKPALAPVYQDRDGLAFRELVALPTEHVDRTFAARGDPSRVVRAKVLAFNDFHGHLSSVRVLEGRPIGGAAVLSSYLKAHARDFDGRVVIAHAGDFVGASPAVSSLFHDEPSIEVFNLLSNGHCDRWGKNRKCNLVGTLGNHEFDKGTVELLRLIRGGNRAQGPYLPSVYRGGRFPTVCANVVDVRTGQLLLPPYFVKDIAGVNVGFVGAVLTGASWFLTKSGIAEVKFTDEAASINASVRELKKAGVRSIVVLMHQGGKQRFSKDLPRDNSTVTGEVVSVISELDGEVDVVVSGHSHSVLSALVPNREGRPTLLTQAYHSGTAFADIELDLDSVSGRVVAKRAKIVSAFADAGPGLVPDKSTLRLVETAERAAKKTMQSVVGDAAVAISQDANEHGESPLGDIVADAQRRALRADFAFVTPAWVRADLAAGPITWNDLFTVQPFGNRLMRVELTGQQVVELLNQQWIVESYSRQLHISGLSYTWDGTKPATSRVIEVKVKGQPIEAGKKYIAAINEFLAEGGEGFSVLAKAPRKASSMLDIDALVDYLKVTPSIQSQLDGRVRRIDTIRTP